MSESGLDQVDKKIICEILTAFRVKYPITLHRVLEHLDLSEFVVLGIMKKLESETGKRQA